MIPPFHRSPPTPPPAHTELDLQRLRSPNDPQLLQIYADHLTTAGDARGPVLGAWLKAVRTDDADLLEAVESWLFFNRHALQEPYQEAMAQGTHTVVFRGGLLWAFESILPGPIEPLLASPQIEHLQWLCRLHIHGEFQDGWRDLPSHMPSLRTLVLAWSVMREATLPTFAGVRALYLTGGVDPSQTVVLPTVQTLHWSCDWPAGIRAPAVTDLTLDTTGMGEDLLVEIPACLPALRRLQVDRPRPRVQALCAVRGLEYAVLEEPIQHPDAPTRGAELAATLDPWTP